MWIQRMDGSRYEEHDVLLVKALIQAETVEGRGPRSGRIKYLSMLFSEAETVQKLAESAQKTAEKPGSITSGASKTSFEQHLESGHTCWCLSSLQDGWNRQSLSSFCGRGGPEYGFHRLKPELDAVIGLQVVDGQLVG